MIFACVNYYSPSPSPAWEQKSGKGPTAEHEAPQIPTTILHFVSVPWSNGSTPNSAGFSAPGSSSSSGLFEPSGSPNASSSATSISSPTLDLISFASVSSHRRSKRQLGTSLANLSSTRLDPRTETKARGFPLAWTRIPEPANETGRLLLQTRTLGKRMSVKERERKWGWSSMG